MTVSNEFSSVRQYDERIGYTKYYIKPQFSLLAKGLDVIIDENTSYRPQSIVSSAGAGTVEYERFF